MAANTIPTVSTLPPAPTRADAPADFTTKADAFVASLPPLVAQVNLTVKGMNDQASYLDQLKTDVNGYKNAAAQSATDASTQAGNAQAYSGQAMGYRDSAQSAAAAAQAAAGLPAISGKTDFMLSVNASGNGVEWRSAPLRPTAARAGQAVAYNAAGNGFEAKSFPLSPITQYFESSPMSPLGGMVLSSSHGFGVRPKIVMLHLVCIQAVQGFSVGDIIEISSGSPIASTSPQPLLQVFYDSIKISVIVNNNSNVSITPKGGNAGGATLGLSTYFNLIIRGAA